MSHSETLTFVCGKLLFNKQKPKMILWMFFEDRAWWILYVLKWDFAVNPLLSYLTDPIIEHVSGNLAWSIYLPIYPKSHQSPGWALRCAMISAAPPPPPPPLACRSLQSERLHLGVGFSPSLTLTVESVRVCYLSWRRSWLLVDIWNDAELSLCEF